jgi:nicotinamide-nucleotide amidase
MKPVKAELLTIGDEILYGQIVDTNSAWMSAELSKVGVSVVRKVSVGDNEEEILQALTAAEQRADVVLITGGIGPTNDDLTKPCLAKFFKCDLVLHEEALAEVTAFFRGRGRELTETNRQQAVLPAACTKITNPVGTAPGMWFEQNGKVVMSMPGVPHEMKKMMTEQVIPRLQKKFTLPAIRHLMVQTAGMGESFLADKIAGWEKALPESIRLAYLPSLGQVTLRLTGRGDSPEVIDQMLRREAGKLAPLIGDHIFSYGGDTLEAVIGRTLRERKLTLAAAESCTGGYLSHLITSVSGSSDYFVGTMIPYADDIKLRQLGVRPPTLEKHGAVSEPAVIEMATGVRSKFNTDIGVATSGIAGPGGATPEKPVGLVWIAYADKHQVVTRKLQLSADRMINIRLASVAVLNLIRISLK